MHFPALSSQQAATTYLSIFLRKRPVNCIEELCVAQ